MKTLAATLFALLLALGAISQVKPDTTNITIGDKEIIVIDQSPEKDTTDVTFDEDDEDIEDTSDQKSELTHWGGIDLGVNMLLNKSGGTTMDSNATWLELDNSRSLSWRINLFEEKIRIYKDYVGIIIGAGLTYNSYGLKNNVDVSTRDSSGTYAWVVPDTIRDYSKNKLRASYVNVPLMLEFNTSDDNEKSFHLAAGVIGGWKMGSIIKQKWEDDNERNELRRKADFNMTPFTLDATARVGYKNLTVFATYGLTPLFKKDKGPEVYPVTVGIQLVPF
jgi:Outer membrane protein beta-barrel domain